MPRTAMAAAGACLAGAGLAGLACLAVPAVASAPGAAPRALPARELAAAAYAAANPIQALAAGPSAWTASKAPLPVGGAANPQASLADMACASAAACVAVGGYTDSAGRQQVLMLTGPGPSWKASKAPLPAGAATKPLAGLPGPTVMSVTCPSASACVAAGYYTNAAAQPQRGGSDGLLLSGHGSSWTATEAALPSGAAASPGAALGGVACPSATTCVAAGHYTDAAGHQQVLLLTGHGSSWTATQAPLPAGAVSTLSASLSDVACPSVSVCVAAGYYRDSAGHQQGLLLTGHGSSWTATKAPMPAGITGNSWAGLYDVACPTVSACVAAGYYTNAAGNQQVLLLTGHGPSWTAVRAPLPGGATTTFASLFRVACPSATVCAVAGYYLNAAGNEAVVVLTGKGPSWTAARAPMPAGAAANPDVDLYSAACPSAANCVIAGDYTDAAGNQQVLLLTGHGPSWTAARVPLPGGITTTLASLTGVACPSASGCLAGGYYTDAAGHQQGLLLSGPG